MIRIRGRDLAVTLVVAALVVGAGACSRASDALDADDRNRFVDSADSLRSSFEEFDASVQALISGETDVAAFVEDANGEVESMRSESDELGELANKVDGDAADIATAAAAAADDIVAASTNAVAAIEASDTAALEAATQRLDDAVNAFDDQVDAWNEL